MDKAWFGISKAVGHVPGQAEVGVLIESETLARQLTQSIERDIRPENSWQTTHEFNPDRAVSRSKRLKLGFINLFPIDPIL